MVRTHSFILVSLITCNFCIQAQSSEWYRINPKPFESTINSATMIPGSNRIVAVGNMATLMYSSDNGENWDLKRRPAGIPKGSNLVSVSFPSNSIGYILGTSSMLLKSTESGESWYDISLPSGFNYSGIYFLDNQTGFLTGHQDFILRTYDGGNSWDTILTVPGITTGSLHFVSPLKGFMGNTGSNYYLKTTDAGLSWQTIYLDSTLIDFKLKSIHFLNDSIGFMMAEDFGQPFYIYKTVNGGITWNVVYNQVLISPDRFYFINEDTGFLYGSTVNYSDIVLQTTDQGETWTQSGSFGWHLTSMVFTENEIGILFGTQSKIYRTFDLGVTWHPEYSSFFDAKIYSAEIVNDSVIIAGGSAAGGGIPSGNMVRTMDGGWTWSHCLNSAGAITDIDFVNDQIGYAVTDGGYYYKTTNGGFTWNGDMVSFGTFYSIAFINDSTGIIGGFVDIGEDDGLFRTEDGGINWTRLENNAIQNVDGEVYDICFANESVGYLTGMIFGTSGMWPGRVMKTTDGGKHWFMLPLDLECFEMRDIECIDENIVFVAGCDFIIKSENGGEAWSFLPLPNENPIFFQSISFYDGEHGFAVGGGVEEEILKTSDGGDSWEIIESPTPVGLNCVRFFNEDQGLIFGNAGVIFKLDTGYIVNIDDSPQRLAETLEFLIYPNPFTDVITINIELITNSFNNKIQIFNLLGELVFSDDVIDCCHDYQINLTPIPPGVYALSINTGRYLWTKKIIKSRT